MPVARAKFARRGPTAVAGRTELAACALLLLFATDIGAKNEATREVIDSIVIHAIGGPHCNSENKPIFGRVTGDAARWKRYFETDPTLGIHWIIDRSGTTAASVPETRVANYARGANQTSIGIELVNNGDGIDEYPKAQIDALTKLVKEIRKRWNIPLSSIKRHSDIDGGLPLPCGIARRVDPGPAFPFDAFMKSLM